MAVKYLVRAGASTVGLSDIKKSTYVFIGVAGLLAYLTNAALSAIFIVSVPMASGWCLEYEEASTDSDNYKVPQCLSFKDDFEEKKYYHNLDMIKRNQTLSTIEFVLWLAVTGMVFYWIPKWKGLPVPGEEFLVLGFIAFLVTFIVPMVLSWILPAPIHWFPSIFRDIREAQVEAALRRISDSL